MTYLVAITLAFAAILSGHFAHAQNEFYDSKIYSEYTDATLYCSNTTYLPVNDTDPVSWMLPNLTVLYVSTGRFNIINDNWTLNIINATSEDLGNYHCLLPVNNGSDYFLVKLGLNAGGPYFEDLWEKYMMNTIIGVSVAGGFAVLCLLLYLLDRFRYREPEVDENPEVRQKREPGSTYDNNSYVEVVEMGHLKSFHEERENGRAKESLAVVNPALDDSLEDGTKL